MNWRFHPATPAWKLALPRPHASGPSTAEQLMFLCPCTRPSQSLGGTGDQHTTTSSALPRILTNAVLIRAHPLPVAKPAPRAPRSSITEGPRQAHGILHPRAGQASRTSIFVDRLVRARTSTEGSVTQQRGVCVSEYGSASIDLAIAASSLAQLRPALSTEPPRR